MDFLWHVLYLLYRLRQGRVHSSISSYQTSNREWCHYEVQLKNYRKGIIKVIFHYTIAVTPLGSLNIYLVPLVSIKH